jgi:hypothetical protein
VQAEKPVIEQFGEAVAVRPGGGVLLPEPEYGGLVPSDTHEAAPWFIAEEWMEGEG